MRTLATASFALMGFLCLSAAHAAVTIESTGGVNTTGPSTLDLNVNISTEGAATTGSGAFSVNGSVAQSGAFGGTVGVTFDAGKNMSLNGATLGDELTDGSFDRDANGFLGVQGNPAGGGISANATVHEGITILFDELSNIAPSVGVQVLGINVQNVGRATGTTVDPAGESFTIVNLITRASITFDPLAQGLAAGTFDVSSLNIYRVGGDSGPVAAIISGDIGGFRIDGLTIDTFQTVVPEPSAVSLLGLGAVLLMRKRAALA